MKKFFSSVVIVISATFLLSPPMQAFGSEKPVKLMCFDTNSHELRRSTTTDGCTPSESSLGAKPIEFPKVRPQAINSFLYVRFLAAQSEARKEKISLQITSGYRSFSRQSALFLQAVKKYGSRAEASKWVLPPEASHHVWGMALDINYPNDPKSTLWLARNGYKYGLCRAYVNEWWHFEALTIPGQHCPARLPNASTTKIN